MTQGRCKDCRYWGQSDHYRTMPHMGRCDCPKMQYGYRVDTAAMLEDEVNIEYDEGWGMLARPMFGCIHFAAKE